MGILGRIGSALFGSGPDPDQGSGQSYGRLADGRDLAGELRRTQKEQNEGEQQQAGEDAVTRYHVPQGYTHAARHLEARLQKEHRALIPRWPRQTRKLKRYMEELGEAENRRQAHRLFRRAWGVGKNSGKLQKLEQKLEGAEDSLFNKFEGGAITEAKFRRESGALKRSMRDLRRLARWR